MEREILRIGLVLSEGTIVSFYEHGVHFGKGRTKKFSELTPEPLTVDQFEKLGFTEYSSGFELGELFINRIINPEEFYYFGRKLEYVHEVQNLYLGMYQKTI